MNSKAEILKQLRDNADLLKKISSEFDIVSKEFQALQMAGKAMLYSCTVGSDGFVEFLDCFDDELSSEQKSHLKRMGIQP